jgi:hypothetical protein
LSIPACCDSAELAAPSESTVDCAFAVAAPPVADPPNATLPMPLSPPVAVAIAELSVEDVD